MEERYEVVAEPVSVKLKFYDRENGESLAGKTRYSCNMIFVDLLMGDCWIHSVNGKLTHEINLMVFQWVKSQGFKTCRLEVPHGTTATRLGKLVLENVNGLDRYEVSLVD